MLLSKVSTEYTERSSTQRGDQFSPNKFRFLLFVILQVVAIASLVSCSWRTSREGSGYPPVVYTRPAASILTDRAVLIGTVNPDGSAAEAWFEYGTDPALPTWTATPRQAKQPVTTPLSFRAPIRGISPYTTYYYRAVASNRFGTQRGDIQAFPTGEYYVAVGDSITLAGGRKRLRTDVERSPQEFEEVSQHRRELGCGRRHLRCRSKIHILDVVDGTNGRNISSSCTGRTMRACPDRYRAARGRGRGTGISRVL